MIVALPNENIYSILFCSVLCVCPQFALLPAILPFQGQDYAALTEFHKFPVCLFLQPVQEQPCLGACWLVPSVWCHLLI